MSGKEKIRVVSYTESDLEKVRNEGQFGEATVNLKTGEITHAITAGVKPPSENEPQGIGIYDPETGKVGRTFFFGNVPKPVRGEVYRWHDEFDPYMMYYLVYGSWLTSIKKMTHWIICPGFDFRFKGLITCNLFVIQQSVKHRISPRLGMIYDENERSMARALFKLAHKAWPVSTRGQFEMTEMGLAAPKSKVDWKGVDKWRVLACSLWWQWETAKDSWEARAADIRELCPGTDMTAQRLRRECAKDRLGLLV